MGEGKHSWASAEWVLMLRNCFVREEADTKLILCSGIPEAWLVSLLRSLDQRRLAQLGNGHALRLPATLLGQASW